MAIIYTDSCQPSNCVPLSSTPLPPAKDRLISHTSLKRLSKIESTFSKERKRKKQRTHYSYDLNYTNARVGEIAHKKGVRPLESHFDEWGQVVKDHAYRRIQIFYYQLLFYFQEDCRVIRSRTRLQHGKASCSCCSSAHSAILPNLRDEKGLMNKDLYLYHTMNATIEMPTIVNDCDCVIEEQMRVIAVDFINLVSLHGLHPYDALEAFTEKMHYFFKFSRQETHYRLHLLYKIEQLEAEIGKLENIVIDDPIAWVRAYAKAIYELKEKRITYQKRKNYTFAAPLEKYDSLRKKLFEGICQFFPNEIHHLNQLTSHKQLFRYLSKRPYFPKPNARTLNKKIMKLKEFLSCHHPVKLFLKDRNKALQLYQRIKPLLSSIFPIPKSIVENARKQLKESHSILNLQAKGSVCPPYTSLSGHKANGKRQPYSVTQLLMQKKILKLTKINS